MKRLRISSKPGMLISLFLVAASVLLLVDPGLFPEFRPAGALHGPVFLDGASPGTVRLYAAGLLLIGVGIGFASLHRSRR